MSHNYWKVQFRGIHETKENSCLYFFKYYITVCLAFMLFFFVRLDVTFESWSNNNTIHV